MVNKILPTSIIKDNPNITYKPYIEYLEGDDLFKEVDKIRNEQKKYLCKNIKANDNVVEFDNINVELQNDIEYETYNIQFREADKNVFDEYNRIQSDFITLNFSYDDLVNHRLLSKTQDHYYLIPIVYKDFYEDIDFKHMIEDYSSFSFSFDLSKGIAYINDVLLNRLKLEHDKKFNVICNVLYDYNEIDFTEKLFNENANENCIKILNTIKNDKTVNLNFDFIPNRLSYKRISNSEDISIQTKTNNYNVTIKNMTYSEYSECKQSDKRSLYYNHEFRFFSYDKNKTALNVLAYDIAKNGFNKPLVFSLDKNFNLTCHSESRLVIAKYLKFPTIPAIILERQFD